MDLGDRLRLRWKLLAKQVSARGGTLRCAQQGDWGLIGGQARTYSVGTYWLA